jgi:hypothetical protein
LDIDSSLVEITDIREGSVIIKFRVKNYGETPISRLKAQLNEILQTKIGYPVIDITEPNEET